MIYARPLQEMDYSDFRQLPNQLTVGPPSVYSLRRTTGALQMRFWPVTNQDIVISYSGTRIVNTLTADDPVDIPEMFLETVWVNLAARLSPMYGASRLEPGTLQMIVARAAELEAQMLDYDRPESYQLGPDYRCC